MQPKHRCTWTSLLLCLCHLHHVHGSSDPNPKLLQLYLCNPSGNKRQMRLPSLVHLMWIMWLRWTLMIHKRLCTMQSTASQNYEQRFLLKIGVDAKWIKEQQHQIKYEAILFLQGKTEIRKTSSIVRKERSESQCFVYMIISKLKKNKPTRINYFYFINKTFPLFHYTLPLHKIWWSPLTVTVVCCILCLGGATN